MIVPARGLTMVSAALLALTGCAAPNTPEACRIAPVAEVPLTIVGNRPVVDVTIAGKPARFLLDTGASGVLITEAAFERLGLRYDFRITGSATSLGAHALIRITEPVVLGLGSSKLKPANLIVLPSATDLTPQNRIDGLLGTSVLADYDIDVDMPRKHLALNEPRRCPAGAPPFEGPSMTFETSPNPRHYMYVPVRIDERDLHLLVDTGASRTYVTAERIGLSSAELSRDREVPVRSAGPAGLTARLHRFGKFQLGPNVWRNVDLLVGPLSVGADGLLGADMWRSRRVWISFAGWAITIQQRGDQK